VSSNAASFERVSAHEGTIRLPTYAIQGENPNPVFRSQYGVAHIYPYTLLDDIASAPSEKSYRTLVLENRYLRVTVIPDLGGRVYSLYDKISDREVFYKNAIVKFSPLAIRGAFFSGGLEFSFPVAHAPTTADPVNWDIRHNEDGSASISFGGLEHISRLRWMITLTLYPDRCALAQDVQLYNPYTIPGRYHYWTNASLDADGQTEFVYPLRRVRSYEFAGTASWPVARLDLIQNDPGLPGMEGVPMWPAERMQEPFDFRWQKNMLAQVSIFGRDVTWDFFGAWQHSTNHGYAHFADHKDVAGMKLWSWGNAGVGVVNQTALTDDGSLYAETQCGAMETQLDFAFLQPAAMRSWREWWIPLRGMGGLTCASAEAGLRLEFTYGQEAGSLDATIGVCPARDLGNSHVEVSVPGKTLLDETASLSPARPWLAGCAVLASDLTNKPIRVVVSDQAGTVVLDYTLDRDTSPILPHVTEAHGEPQTSEVFTQLGLKHENFDNREQAQAAYQKAIELSPENGEAHFRLGLMQLRAADFSASAEHLREAVSLGLVEGNYYLGLIGLLEGRLEDARKAFQAVPADHPLWVPALLGLGTLAMRDKDWQKAIDQFRQAYRRGEMPIATALLLGIALQRAGQIDEARAELEGVLAVDPLNHAALRELAHIQTDGSYQVSLYQAKLDRMLADDRQYHIDLACFYMGAGLLEDALSALEDAARAWSYPMLGYLAAYLYNVLNRQKEADTWLAWATAGSPEYVFPSRLEEYLALMDAIERNPGDYKAKYYLGNFLYARQRFDEGVRLWREALHELTDFDILYRNLGLAAWQREKDLPKAVGLFERGMALNPDNQDLYLHLDELYKVLGLTEKRQQLLEKIESLPNVREDVRKRSMLIRVDLGRYEEALHILQTEQFVPLEMDQSFHELYVRALMQRAGARMNTGKIEEAIADYRKALEFPANLGVGQPTTLAQAHIYYHLGLAYEQLGRFQEALQAWLNAAGEHHPHGDLMYEDVQMALDKLSRYSELGLEA
jgi:tetratricopeptide (TPR) repeat protein